MATASFSPPIPSCYFNSVRLGHNSNNGIGVFRKMRGNNTRTVSSFQNQELRQICSSKIIHAHVLFLSASVLFLSPEKMVMAAESSHPYDLCHIGTVLTKSESQPLKTDKMSSAKNGKSMMRGMTAKNFDPAKYSGRWFEVASLKRGFAATGQEDCHCTQGLYTYDAETASIQVETLCVHGSPDGNVTGIQGKVQCLSEEDKENSERDLENQKMIRQKCYLRFPTLPFIPKEPYDVIATDYDNYALVSGAKDTSFVQIYSRTPNPGPAFIKKYKSYLEEFGYDPSEIKDTPQDCNVMSSKPLDRLLSLFGIKEALTNEFPDLALKKSVEFNPLTNVFSTFKKLLDLYFS